MRFGPVPFAASSVEKFEELYEIFRKVEVISGLDNVLKLDMLGGSVRITTIRDKTKVEVTDTVDVQWVGYTDEIEPFGFMIIENGQGVYGPYHVHTR